MGCFFFCPSWRRSDGGSTRRSDRISHSTENSPYSAGAGYALLYFIDSIKSAIRGIFRATRGRPYISYNRFTVCPDQCGGCHLYTDGNGLKCPYKHGNGCHFTRLRRRHKNAVQGKFDALRKYRRPAPIPGKTVIFCLHNFPFMETWIFLIHFSVIFPDPGSADPISADSR